MSQFRELKNLIYNRALIHYLLVANANLSISHLFNYYLQKFDSKHHLQF